MIQWAVAVAVPPYAESLELASHRDTILVEIGSLAEEHVISIVSLTIKFIHGTCSVIQSVQLNGSVCQNPPQLLQ